MSEDVINYHPKIKYMIKCACGDFPFWLYFKLMILGVNLTMKILCLPFYLFVTLMPLGVFIATSEPVIAQNCDGNYNSSSGVQIDTSGHSREQSRRVNSRICPDGGRNNNRAPTNVNADTGVQYSNNCNKSPNRNNDVNLSGKNTVNVGTNVSVDVCDPTRR